MLRGDLHQSTPQNTAIEGTCSITQWHQGQPRAGVLALVGMAVKLTRYSSACIENQQPERFDTGEQGLLESQSLKARGKTADELGIAMLGQSENLNAASPRLPSPNKSLAYWSHTDETTALRPELLKFCTRLLNGAPEDEGFIASAREPGLCDFHVLW